LGRHSGEGRNPAKQTLHEAAIIATSLWLAASI
jgi:hypothetical protein